MIEPPFTEYNGIYRIVGEFAGPAVPNKAQASKRPSLARLLINSAVTNAFMSRVEIKNGKVVFSAEHLVPDFVQRRVNEIFKEAGVL